MLIANGIEGKYLEYLGKPLVRQGNELFYGSMSDKYYLYIMITKEEPSSAFNINLPTNLFIQIMPTDPNELPPAKMQKSVSSLSEAFEYGIAWLERANRA